MAGGKHTVEKSSLNKIINATKHINKKIKKTMKREILKQCEQFCKNDYMKEMDKVFKKNYTGQVLSLEGDIRLVPNEKMEREIR